MTDYLITLDTEEQFLMHHGVQGMKWGKWNAETAARYAGGVRSDRTVRMTSKAEQHRMKANEFRAKRDSKLGAANIAQAKANKAATGTIFRDPNMEKAAKQEMRYAKNVKNGAKYSKKYAKADKKAIKYEVKAYKSDAEDSSLGPERKTVRDLKKHRISMNDAKARTEAKVKDALANVKTHEQLKAAMSPDISISEKKKALKSYMDNEYKTDKEAILKSGKYINELGNLNDKSNSELSTLAWRAERAIGLSDPDTSERREAINRYNRLNNASFLEEEIEDPAAYRRRYSLD